MSLSSYGKALVVVIACALSAGVVWWGMSARIDLQAERAARAEQRLAEAEQINAQQKAALERAQATVNDLTEIRQGMQQLAQNISRNAQQQTRALEELKRHDQTVSDYLRGLVPAGLGSLYARPETTDPAGYRAAPLVRSDAVPISSPPSAAEQ